MLFAHLHALTGNCPHLAPKIDLGPTGTSHLTGSRRGEDGELECSCALPLGVPEVRHRSRQRIDLEGCMMDDLRYPLGRRKHGIQIGLQPGGVGTLAVLARDRVIENVLDARPHTGGRLVLVYPDWRQDRVDVRRLDVLYEKIPDNRVGISCQRRAPLRPVLEVAPPRLLRRNVRGCTFGKGLRSRPGCPLPRCVPPESSPSIGSCPCRTPVLATRAAALASARLTSGYPPSPLSRRLPSSTYRIPQLRAFAEVPTCRPKPATPPTMWRPGRFSLATSRAVSSFTLFGIPSPRKTPHKSADGNVRQWTWSDKPSCPPYRA